MKVSEWISRHPGVIITVAPDAALGQIADRLLEEKCLRDIYVITNDGHVAGHIAHKKLVHVILAEQRRVHTRRQIMDIVCGGSAGELMNDAFVSAHPDENLDEVLHRQIDHDIEDMPVIDDNNVLLGAVNITKVLLAIHTGTLEWEGGS